ncbi:FG-GAP repeat protein [bacterium]|nr:FG-GAP repeat protein [bacterium]
MKRVLIVPILISLAAFAGAQFPAAINIDQFSSSDGVIIPGGTDYEFGYPTVPLGDFNGDGISDIALGSPNGEGIANNVSRAGEVVVVYGKYPGLSSTINPASMSPSDGFVIYNTVSSYSSFGRDIAGGDFNGDGLADLAIGEQTFDSSNNGQANFDGICYLIFGKPGGIPSTTVDYLSSLNGNSGDRGFIVIGRQADKRLGLDVVLEDINGDGLDDLIMGSWGDSFTGVRANSGEIYVIFGSRTNFGPGFDLNGINGSNGTVLVGPGSDYTGRDLRPAKDVNGDGVNDLLILNGAGAGPGDAMSNRGEFFVVHGRRAWPQSVDLSTYYSENGGDGSLGSVILGVETNFASFSNAPQFFSAGDLNADGYPELSISNSNYDTPDGNTGVGAGWVIPSGPGGIGPGFALSYNNAVIGQGFQHRFAFYGRDPLDLNGDGIADLFAVAGGADDVRLDSGKIYTIYGAPGLSVSSSTLGAIDGNNGFLFRGVEQGERFGSPFPIGDINADGIGDLAAYRGETNSVYVLYGKRSPSVTSSSATAFAASGGSGDSIPPIDFGPTVRAIVDFEDISFRTSGFDSSSSVTAEIVYSNTSLSGLDPLDQVATSYWILDSDRTGFGSADVTFHWVPSEVELLEGDPSTWSLHQSPGTSGPWTMLDTTITTGTATATVTDLGVFALVSPGAPPPPSIEVFLVR